MKQKPTIVGLDPGTTTGIAVLDLECNLIDLYSSKELSVSDVVDHLTETGRPVILATDVFPTPKMVEETSRKFDVVLFTPQQPLSTEEKADLAKTFVSDYELNEPTDDHQRDALAAALKAFNHYQNKFRQIEKRLQDIDLLDEQDTVKELVVRGLSMEDAISALSPAEEEVVPKEVEEAPPKDVAELLEVVDRLRMQIRYREKEIEHLQKRNEKLQQHLERYGKMVDELHEEIKKLKSKREKEVSEAEAIKKREEEISRLKAELAKERKRTIQLEEDLEKLKKVKVEKEDKIPVKVIKGFSKEGIEEIEQRYGIKPGDVIYLVNASGGGPQTAEKLIERDVKAIITGTKMSHIAREKLEKAKIPLLEKRNVPLEREGALAIVSRETLENAIKSWKETRTTKEREKHKRIIQKLTDKFGRVKK